MTGPVLAAIGETAATFLAALGLCLLAARAGLLRVSLGRTRPRKPEARP